MNRSPKPTTASAAALPLHPDAPWLAPLAGFSDLPFRLLCRERGAAVACTEMVSAKGLVYGVRQKELKGKPGLAPSATEDLLATTPEDAPLVVQLFGAEAEYVAEAAALLRERGFVWFDLNMGCSVPKVTKTGAGAAMLRDLPNALSVAKALIAGAGPGKAGFKIRLGWDAPVFLDFARALEDAGAAWITLHPRLARQGFSGKADHGALERLARTLSIPVIASGDLFTASDAITCLGAGVRGVMFARGAMSNPMIFSQYHMLRREREEMHPTGTPLSSDPNAAANIVPKIADRAQGSMPDETAAAARGSMPDETAATARGRPGRMSRSDAPDHAELLALIRRHAELARQLTPGRPGRKGYSPALLKMRTVVPRYVRHLPDVKQLRLALTSCESWEHLDTLLHHFFKQYPCK